MSPEAYDTASNIDEIDKAYTNLVSIADNAYEMNRIPDAERPLERFSLGLSRLSRIMDRLRAVAKSIREYEDESYYRIVEADEDEFDPETTDQKYTSANTSINSSKLPAIYKMISDRIKSGMVGLDIGGGKFDNAIEALADQDIELHVYDPYNRSDKYNKESIAAIRSNGGADFVVNSNVLNVIAEEDARLAVIRNCYRFLKSGCYAYFTVYEGSGTGEGGETKAGYQLNRKTADYVDEIESVFDNVSRKGKLIIAKK